MAVAALSAAVVASAANLIIQNGPVLQANTVTDLECDSDGVTINWGAETNGATVNNVRIADIHTDCFGSELHVDVEGSGINEELFLASIDNSSETLAFSTPLLAADVTSIVVMISG